MVVGVIGTAAHSQVDAVVQHLRSWGVPVVVIDFQSAERLNLRLGRDGRWTMRFGESDLSRLSVAWAADKHLYKQFGQTQEWADRYMTAVSWKDACRNLARVLPCPVVNAPEAVDACQFKLWQLGVAAEEGFHVPASIVANSGKDVAAWKKADDSLIIKALGDPHIPRIGSEVDQTAIMTCDLPASLLEEHSNLEPHPIFVQENVAKRYEHRVVVVEDEIFSFRIDPNQHPIMAVDYRRGGHLVDYVPEELPLDFRERLVGLHRRFGLFSGCYDFIETPAGDMVFLEVNPSGIWAKHDTISGGQISRAFAASLVRPEDGLA